MQTKIKPLMSFLIALMITILVVQSVSAGKFHFNSLNFSLGGSMLVQGSLLGLGNERAEVTLIGYGTVTGICENNGGKQAPGRNPVEVSVMEKGVFYNDSNGRALVSVIAPDPEAPEFAPSPTPKQAGCPSGNWQVVGIVDGSTNWTGAEIIVKDQDNLVRIHQAYTCTTFFVNGIAKNISCVEN